MAHLVEKMMYVGEVPWHGLGLRIPEEVSAVDALDPAGLNWRVTLSPLAARLRGGDVPVPGHHAVVRESDRSVLGVVGAGYEEIQNRDVAELADAIAGEGSARCHTAGSLAEGRRVWFLLKLDGTFRAPGDTSEVEKYLLLTSSHDGSGALRVLPTPVRVVCNNTLSFALRGVRQDAMLSVRHSIGVGGRIEQARKALDAAGGVFARFERISAALAEAPYGQDALRALAVELMPARDESAVPTVTAVNRAKLVSLASFGTGVAEVRGTAWAAYQAVTEYVDHSRRYRDAGARANSIWFGTGAQIKGRALAKIAEDVGLDLAA